MVALPLAPSCIRIRVLGKLNQASIAHIMHAQYAGGTPSNADCLAYANGFRSAFNTRFAALLPNVCTYNTFEVVDLGSATGAIGTSIATVTGSGTTGTSVPNSACQVISWKVALRYRGGHPRTYLPYMGSTALGNGNALPATVVTNLTTAANGFITDLNAITSGTLTFAFALVSYFHGHSLRPLGTPYLISSATVHNRVDTQRRRLGKEF